MLTSGSVVVLN